MDYGQLVRRKLCRPSLEGHELQLRPQPPADDDQEAARHPPFPLPPPSAASAPGSHEQKYSTAQHLRHLTREELEARERVSEQWQGRVTDYAALSSSLRWPLFGACAVAPDTYSRSVGSAAYGIGAWDCGGVAGCGAKDTEDWRRRKDEVLLHGERMCRHDRVMRALDPR